MAVEARRGNPFHAQLIANRGSAGAADFFAGQAEEFMPTAAAAAAATPDLILPLSRCYQQPRVVPEIFAVKPSVKTDSGLSTNYNVAAAAVPVPRNQHKRSRDALGDDHLNGDLLPANHNPQKMSKASLFLGPEAACEIQRHQLEIDRLISQHTQRLRWELEDRVKQQSKALLSSIHDSVVRKLKEKDEEIQRMGKLNWLLQEKVKNLVMENQIWRGLAQTNEAAANSLRSNLEHALARSVGVGGVGGGGGEDDDAESCCGSNDPGRAGASAGAAAESRRGRHGRGGCRACGERESSVLLLPCRHLCLCAACGPSHHDCPACGSAVTASVHVNLSSSS
ncbi:BOI-related E3 ubiquitin-protein ligase 1-like [Syzygium oleosum]|uniref:BOI-related E3 ubiquitin-protein ligase 1-like n=1 Tax=Syzygium oleosum TaxID=219896 RepID=UPI0024BBE466|nr:BOI-related E3 ubiquitin-protein ligase 1-like [Syzygium oleosum]